jgi:site-specific DNA-methyltransferase (adenine-specific)
MSKFREEIIGDCRLILGDCLEVMPTLEPVAAVVTDPPYCSGARTSAAMSGRGGMSRGQRWASKPITNDRMTVTGFTWLIRHVAAQSYALLPEGGSLISFIDWRQYPTLYGVVESVNFRVQGVAVWDKEDMALGNGFRNQHEFALHASKGVPTVHHKGTPNVLRVKRISSSELHPTEKPVELLRRMAEVVTDRGETILDPFMGSGTTGVACVNLGRKFIGIELEPKYFDIACKRIEEAYKQPRLFEEPAPKPVQESML